MSVVAMKLLTVAGPLEQFDDVVKAVRAAIQKKDKVAAEEALKTATSTVSKIAGKGVIHWKNASRKVSRLAKAVNALDA